MWPGRRGCRPKEQMGDMSGEEHAFHAKVDPVGGEVWLRDTPLLVMLVDMRLEGVHPL